MVRNLLVLGCAALLALGLSFGSFAGSITDADGDGVPDIYDNCVTTANGPLAATDSCDAQEDGDLDGYGNPCDYDTNNDGGTGLDDLGFYIDNVAIVSTNPVFDNNCDGGAGLDDLGFAIDNSAVVTIPGPSGLACAGTSPCVAE